MGLCLVDYPAQNEVNRARFAQSIFNMHSSSHYHQHIRKAQNAAVFQSYHRLVTLFNVVTNTHGEQFKNEKPTKSRRDSLSRRSVCSLNMPSALADGWIGPHICGAYLVEGFQKCLLFNSTYLTKTN